MEKLIGKFKEKDLMNAGKVWAECESIIFLETVGYMEEDDIYTFEFMEELSGGFSSVGSAPLTETQVKNWIENYNMHQELTFVLKEINSENLNIKNTTKIFNLCDKYNLKLSHLDHILCHYDRYEEDRKYGLRFEPDSEKETVNGFLFKSNDYTVVRDVTFIKGEMFSFQF